MRKTLSKFLTVFILFSLTLGGSLSSVSAKSTSSLPVSKVDVGKEGMVATAEPYATRVGQEVLEKGGTAVDAAVAVQLALNVTEPMMSGIGGGGFMMVYDGKTKQVSIMNSREKAPSDVTADLFLDENGKAVPFKERHTSGKAVGVPGTLLGLEEAHEKWGKLKWKALVKPAENLAKDGFNVSTTLSDSIEDSKDKLSEEAKRVYAPNGQVLKEGALLKQRDLAKTLQLIGKEGSQALYDGELGKAIVKTVKDHGGSMTAEDLKNYTVKEQTPIKGTYHGYDIISMPPPSSGGLTVLQILKMLEPYDISQYGARSKEKYNLVAEAMHLAFADRNKYIGDTDFVNVPISGMLNENYLAKRSKEIQLLKANKNVKPGDPWSYQGGKPETEYVPKKDDKEIGQTTHFTIADKWGNLVSYTTTIEQVFGTGIMVPGYGVMLNNEMTDFDAYPGGPNEVQPNKRPMSSMSPTIVLKDHKPVMTVGSPGGPTIIASVAQTLINKIDYGMSAEAAIEEPRIYTPTYPNIRYEKGIPSETIKELEKLGYKFDDEPEEIGNVQTIDIYDSFYLGAADSSRVGSAAGVDTVKGK